MLRRRLIPVVLLDRGRAVQSKRFSRRQVLGNPVTIVERLADWSSDELLYLDVTRGGGYDSGRGDLAGASLDCPLDVLSAVASRCVMPLTFGGGIRSVADAEARVERGADKVAVTTGPLDDPGLIDRLASALGSQCVTVGIDARRRDAGDAAWIATADGGRRAVRLDAVAWAREAADRGAGEILIQSVDRDGGRTGYDLDLIEAVAGAVPIPVIALGGAGDADDLAAGIAAGADAVAAANMFNHVEHAVHKAKVRLHAAGAPVRPPSIEPVLALVDGPALPASSSSAAFPSPTPSEASTP